MFQNNLLMGAASISTDAAYTIDYSCRFDLATTSRLTRTNSGTPTDASKGVVGMWIKRSNLGIATTIFDCNGQGYDLAFEADDELTNSDHAAQLTTTTQALRDVSAWYHIVSSYDSDQTIGGDRNIVYINGKRVMDYSYYNVSSQATSGEAWGLSEDALAQTIGSSYNDLRHWSGYMSQYFLVDGLSIQNGDFTIASFGEFSNNVWRPIDLTGLTFGTNGYLLDFADSSNLGNDVSGNDNDWTSDSIASDDQFSDTPTKNFATYNPLDQITATATFEDGNLVHNKSTTGYAGAPSTIPIPTTGKWAFKIKITGPVSGSQDGALGIFADEVGNFYTDGTVQSTASWYNCVLIEAYSDGGFRYQFDDGGAVEHYNGPAAVTDDEFEFLVDRDAGTVDIVKNGSAYGSQLTGLPSDTQMWPGSINYATNTTATFDYTPSDTAYKTLCTANLPEPTIKDGRKYYDTILYEGNGDAQKVGQFQPITETYSVGNSALFVKGDSTELRQTFGATASSTKDGTLSMWLKIGDITGGAGGYVVTCGGAGGDFIKIEGGLIKIQLNNESNGQWTSTNKIDDTTQWTNLVVAYDLDNGTATDRIQIYINGVNITDDGTFGSTVTDAAFEMFQDTIACAFGGKGDGAADYLYDGYMAEAVWCDGQVLAPSSFGEVDSTTNRWIPKDVSGLTFGNNGFYLDFADKNDLGDDESGNTNDWTESGFDTTNGSNQYYDTPTRNFAILDPGRTSGTTSNGNLTHTSPASQTGYAAIPQAFGLTSGKWYWEAVLDSGTTNARQHGMVQNDVSLAANSWFSSRSGTYSAYYSYDGDAITPGDITSATGESTDYGDTFTSGDVISCAVDLDIGAIWWAKNGTWQASATEAEIEAGDTSNAAQSGLASGAWYACINEQDGFISTANFGQHIYFDSTTLTLDTAADGYFRHAVPDGFKAINVDALTESDSFQSAFSWIKNRDTTDFHMLFDRPRGIFNDIHSNSNDIQVTDPDTLTRFLKQGATIGDDVQVNTAAESYVYWDWFIESTGSGASNEVGSINTISTLVDTTSGFSVGTYQGTGSAATIGHGLGVAPAMIMLKNISSLEGWRVYHQYSNATPEDFYLNLEATSAATDLTTWNDTAPTSTVFSIGTNASENESGATIVYYAFAEIEGFSKFGSYIGNGTGSGAGPFSYTGFTPAFIICKAATRTSDWYMSDSARNPFPSNETAYREIQYANLTYADSTGYGLQIYSNGFKQYDGNENNSSTETYIYMAFAQNPFGGASTTPATAR